MKEKFIERGALSSPEFDRLLVMLLNIISMKLLKDIILKKKQKQSIWELLISNSSKLLHIK